MRKNELLEKLKDGGFPDPIIGAFSKVRRKNFIPLGRREYAYDDIALPIGFGRTISRPSTIAFVLTRLDPRPRQKILEVGSDSGYVLALLAEIAPGA